MPIPQPDIRPIEDGEYRLAANYKYVYGENRFVIHEGFIHDGASVPRLVWTITGLRPDGLLRAAALIHDALYQFRGKLPKFWVRPHRTFTRAECDRAFYDIMRAAGVGWWKANVAYTAVRAGGWISWRKQKRRLSSSPDEQE